MVRQVTGDGARISLVVGCAGSGKTYATGAAVDAFCRAGLQVIGTAPTGAAARELERETNAPAPTIDSLLGQLQHPVVEAAQVAETLGFGHDLHSYPVLCMHVARLPWMRDLLVDGIPVLAASALRPALQVTRQALSPEQVQLVAAQVQASFQPAV